MDKKEEEILDDILDGETAEEELPVIPESLRGEPEIGADLEDFTEEGESADAKKIKEPENPVKKSIFKVNIKVVAICVAAILVVGGGLFAFWQLGQLSGSHIMTFEGKKISIEEFKLYLLMSTNSYTPKEDAISGLTEFLVLEKAAKDMDIELTDEDKNEVKEYRDYIIDVYGIPLGKLNLGEERLIEILALDNIYYKLWDKVSEELNFTVDEAAFASELEMYRADSHGYIDIDMKYVLTYELGDAETARSALLSGMAADDAIREYSDAYDDETGDIDIIPFSQIGVFDSEQAEHILSLGVSDISDVIDINGEFYLVFIIQSISIPTSEEIVEIEADFRLNYIDYQKYQLFMIEFESWKNEAKFTINDKAFDEFDTDKFYGEFFEG